MLLNLFSYRFLGTPYKQCEVKKYFKSIEYNVYTDISYIYSLGSFLIYGPQG